MATLSAQIGGMSASQKMQLSGKLKPLIGPLTALMPFAAPMVASFVGASPGMLAMAIGPVEGMLPPQAKSLIQGAINQVLGPAGKTPSTTTSTGRRPTPRPIVARPGMPSLPGSTLPGMTETGDGGTMKKVLLAVGGVGLGFWLLTKMGKPRKNPKRGGGSHPRQRMQAIASRMGLPATGSAKDIARRIYSVGGSWEKKAASDVLNKKSRRRK